MKSTKRVSSNMSSGRKQLDILADLMIEYALDMDATMFSTSFENLKSKPGWDLTITVKKTTKKKKSK